MRLSVRQPLAEERLEAVGDGASEVGGSAGEEHRLERSVRRGALTAQACTEGGEGGAGADGQRRAQAGRVGQPRLSRPRRPSESSVRVASLVGTERGRERLVEIEDVKLGDRRLRHLNVHWNRASGRHVVRCRLVVSCYVQQPSELANGNRRVMPAALLALSARCGGLSGGGPLHPIEHGAAHVHASEITFGAAPPGVPRDAAHAAAQRAAQLEERAMCRELLVRAGAQTSRREGRSQLGYQGIQPGVWLHRRVQDTVAEAPDATKYKWLVRRHEGEQPRREALEDRSGLLDLIRIGQAGHSEGDVQRVGRRTGAAQPRVLLADRVLDRHGRVDQRAMTYLNAEEGVRPIGRVDSSRERGSRVLGSQVFRQRVQLPNSDLRLLLLHDGFLCTHLRLWLVRSLLSQ